MKVAVTDREDVKHELDVPEGTILMETLRVPDYGVAAICGGLMACATCHVYVREADLARLSPPSDDELELLGGLSGMRPNSRLSCQIHVTPRLEGLAVTIAPEE